MYRGQRSFSCAMEMTFTFCMIYYKIKEHAGRKESGDMEQKKVTEEAVRQWLEESADTAYKKFQENLLPGIGNILGVRLPVLRTMAKKLVRQDWQEWFFRGEDTLFEETMLRGLVMAYANVSVRERFACIRAFVPAINNWAVCDSVCNTIKEAEKYPEEYWEFLGPYFDSDEEYEARFGAVMLLSHFVREEYLEGALCRLQSVHQKGYYAKMAVAWAISVYFAAFPEAVLAYLKSAPELDEFTYRKTLQKILESDRVDRDMKKTIREMRQRG